MCKTFASSEGRDLSGSGSDVIDDGVLEPWDPEHNKLRLVTESEAHQTNQT